MVLMIRKIVSLNIVLQIKDKRDYTKTLEEYIIKRIPLPGIMKLLVIANRISKIRTRKNNTKWTIKEYEIKTRNND